MTNTTDVLESTPKPTATGPGQAEKTRAFKSPVSRLLAPIRNTLIFASVLQGISAAAGVVPFIAVGELGRVLLAESQIDAGRAWLIAWIGVGALIVRLFFQMAAGAVTHFADADFQLDLRRKMVDRIGRVPLGWFTERNAGQVKKALQDDVGDLHHLVGHAYLNLTSAFVTPLVALTYLLWVDWRLTLISIIPLIAGIGLYAYQMRGYGQKMTAYNEALGRVNAASVEFVQGIAVVKTFGQARKSYGRFLDETHKFMEYFWNWVRGLIKISSASEIVMSPVFSLVVILAGGIWFVANGWMAPVDVIPFAVLGLSFTAPFLTMSYAQNDTMLAKEAAERIVALLDAPTLPAGASQRVPNGARVEFDNVSFSYDDRTDVLKDITLTLEPGTVTALVGPSGSGKSTLAKLLPRFWDPKRGQIVLGGVPIHELPSTELYKHVGFVFQDVQLLRASVRDNIALGRPDASQNEIEAAAKAAQIHDRVLELPNGYESVVGEDARLSSGEAQRVSIARALLADVPLLVLDEATAFADPESEAAIQDALAKLVAGRTLLVIAHRLHTITGADQICVLKDGEIVERGSHKALLAQNGLYARLWAAAEGADSTEVGT